MGRISIHQLKQNKAEGKRFAMITAYDYPMARLVEQAGIPIILVGDSLGSVVLGYESTVPVTMDDILYHTRAVVRATSKAIVVADMPFMSYQANADEAMRNAGRLLQEGGATAVKLEGGSHVAPLVRRMVESGIPVMGHLGLTPQSVNQFGGHKVQGKTPAAAAKLLNDARALEEAGAFAVVLETIPAPLARMVTERISIPTIGIGAGPHCDGQVQVLH
ncbi:MAG TPA: 3-methyl-2-oxobutanoate hydroxymethyltransferase, partial [Tepidiformaceae bacterium]|nr:3-methyl-2-oxobutanoate hydroxymethyltransferase [Tepidiformaceae bacterium]